MDIQKIITDYNTLAKQEAIKAMANEIKSGGTMRGAEYLHHTLENIMMVKALGPELIAGVGR